MFKKLTNQFQVSFLVNKKLFSSSAYDLAIIGGGPGGKLFFNHIF